MSEESSLGQCASCGKTLPLSQLRVPTEDDTQGYSPAGVKVCAQCLENIRYEAFQVEDEDVYDLEDDE